jgi:hypothetical protein
MPDGPPWIHKAYEEVVQLGPFPVDRHPAYQLELDENRRWMIECTATRAQGTDPELGVRFARPSGGEWKVFLDWNDKYGNMTGPWRDFKFDNEDIAVFAIYKDRMDPALDWKDCSRAGVELDTGGDRGWGIFTFTNGSSQVKVKIST